MYEDFKIRKFTFTIPKDASLFFKNYTNEQNNFKQFIKDCCELGLELYVLRKKIYAEYQKYSKDNCMEEIPKNIFFRMIIELENISNERKRYDNSKNALACLKGIDLKKELNDDTDLDEMFPPKDKEIN